MVTLEVGVVETSYNPWLAYDNNVESDDKTELLYPLLGLNKMDDDTEDLVIDSPDLSPVEDEDLSDVDGLTTLRGTSAAPGPGSSTAAKPKKDRDGDRKQVSEQQRRRPAAIVRRAILWKTNRG